MARAGEVAEVRRCVLLSTEPLRSDGAVRLDAITLISDEGAAVMVRALAAAAPAQAPQSQNA